MEIPNKDRIQPKTITPQDAKRLQTKTSEIIKKTEIAGRLKAKINNPKNSFSAKQYTKCKDIFKQDFPIDKANDENELKELLIMWINKEDTTVIQLQEIEVILFKKSKIVFMFKSLVNSIISKLFRK